MSFSFPFTFRFAVPGLSNPFFSSAPAAGTATTDLDRARMIDQQEPPRRKKRTYDSSFPERDIKRPSGLPTPPLVRKRGWGSATSMPSEAEVLSESPRSVFESSLTYGGDTYDDLHDSEEVELDLPPSKRRKGITGSVVSSAFNTLLVGAAVGLTMFRLWRDRGKDPEQSPPPPYQEEWAPPNVQPQELPPKPSTTQLEVPSEHKVHVSAVHHRRVAPSTRRTQKPSKRVVTTKRDASPRKPRAARIVPREIEPSIQMDEDGDEMDWIGDKLSRLIEEGKRALGAEIVVSSEAPEDEVDDGTGDWIEDEEMSASFAFESHRNVLGSPSKKKKKNRFANAYSAPPRASAFTQSHSRTFSDDVSSANTLTPFQTTSDVHMSAGDEMSESPSVREAMDRARALYRQRRGF